MFFKKIWRKHNRIHFKILLPFLCLIFLFASAEIFLSSKRMSKDIEEKTAKLLQNNARLINEVMKEQEEKTAFYAQFMADVTKLSHELTDTSAGHSVLIYLLGSLKKDRIKIRMYRGVTENKEQSELIQKGFLGIQTTSLVASTVEGESGLSIAAVGPIERQSGIREVIIAEFPLNQEFLEGIKRKTGADITLFYQGNPISSTLSGDFQNQLFSAILNEELQDNVLNGGNTVLKGLMEGENPQKISFNPLSIHFRNQGIYAVSLSVKEVLVSKRTILLQNILIIAVILTGLGLIYYILVRRLTRPIMELSSASKRVAEGDLSVNIQIKTKDELGDLGKSFNRMVNQLKISEDKLKKKMDELSRLYKEVSKERNISKSILDNLTSGVILFDPYQRVMLINPAAQQWLGVKEDKIRGMRIIGKPEDPSLKPLYSVGAIQPTEEMIRCWKYFHCTKEECPGHNSEELRCWLVSGTFCHGEVPEQSSEKQELCKECDVYKTYCSELEKQKEVRVEELELAEPNRRVLKVFLSPIFDVNRRLLGSITVLNDITQEKEIDRLKTEFVSLVSHELRTPLSSIKAFTEILLRKPGRDIDEQVEFLKIMSEETDRLTRLINDILDITRIEEKNTESDRKPTDIVKMIDKSVLAHGSSAQKKHITMKKDTQKGIPHVWGDEDTIMQVLGNLLNNAIKYSPEGSSIQISARLAQSPLNPNKEIEIRIKDNGIGIPSKYLEKVFERFYRINQPLTENEQGTGLGLYLCKNAVEKYGGRIWVESQENKGSTFIFTLPLVENHETPSEEKMDSQSLVLPPYPKGLMEKISILIVDDDKRSRHFLRYYMEEEGFKVYEAAGGSSALEFLKNNQPDLIFLDIVMPEIDGYDVLEAVRKNKSTKDIPVIVLSGAEDATTAMELGATDYLIKPIDREKLLKAVAEILKKAIS